MHLFCGIISVMVLGAPLVQAQKTHPTLPTMWNAETIDPPMGKGLESYNFVATPTIDNPSAMWSNYTGCERLIYYDGTAGSGGNSARYLLGCDAVDCCRETQDGNQVEFQIPNVYYADPNKVVNVTYGGLKNVTVFDEVVEADVWEWEFDLPGTSFKEYFQAYTQDCADCVNGVTLVLWEVYFDQKVNPTGKIQFKNYRGIPEDEAASFKASFAIPLECQANNILTCNVDDNGVTGEPSPY